MTVRMSRVAFATLGAILFAASANAQDAGPYVGVGVGLVKAPTTTITDTASRSVKFDDGRMGSLALGYDYGANWRSEVELSRRSVGLNTIDGLDASGNLRATNLMVNAIYDLDISSPLTPYLGVGVGVSQIKLNNAGPFGASSINDSDRRAAAQGIAGVSYTVSESVDLFADYRYFTTRNIDMFTAAGNTASFSPSAHSLMAGLRFNFGAPVAVKPQPVAEPVAEPAPAMPRNYIVFFDWDKADITPEAAAIIQAAAANAGTMGVVRLSLTGHADRSGSDAYNLKLSKRRADAVKAMFAKMGFKDGEMAVVAKGETDPLVPTDDGVREPQNRRVEIVMP